MMGKGAEGGCTRNGCNGSTTVGMILPLSKGPAQSGSMSRLRGYIGQERRNLDVFSQVFKSLAVKPAFAELGSSAASNGSLNTPISSENRRKQRTKKNDVNGTLLKDSLENSWYKDFNGGPFWLHMEEYFREPTTQDIHLLVPKTKLDPWSLCGSLDPLLQIPVSEIAKEVIEQQLLEEAGPMRPSAHCFDVQSLPDGAIEDFTALKTCVQDQQRTKRKLVASGSASKRRKLVSPTSDTVTAVISPPENGDEELCDVCYGGESDEKNQILFCDSCNVAVHQECYGIKAVPEDQWLCSMCIYRIGTAGKTLPRDFHDCILCPVKGGALKVIASLKEQPCNVPTNAVFGHLFCCQWIPETYIGDMEVMEPIMNIEGVRDERWKLLCSICKEKHGACIQCSHGLCATAFHPLCARQAKLRMEVSSKANGDEIDLRAYCPKHTLLGGKPVRADCETELDMLDANGGTGNKISSNKTGKKSKMAISRRADYHLSGDTSNDNVGSVFKRGMAANGRLSLNFVKDLLGRTDSNVVDVDAIHIKNNGKILSDQGVHEDMRCWKSGLSCFPDMLKELPFVVGKNSSKSSDFEQKESVNLSSKESACKLYRNKRRKLEQQETVPQLRSKDDAQVPDIYGLERIGPVEISQIESDSSVVYQNEHPQVTTSVHWDQCADELAVYDEARRLRGLNGEASTSQGISCTSQHPIWPNALKGSKGDLGRISVLEGKVCRLEDGAYIHPFLLTRLLKFQSSISVWDSEIEAPTLEFSWSPASISGASLRVEGHQIKVSRNKRCQFQNSTHKRSAGLAVKFSKIGPSDSLEAQLQQLEHAKKMGILEMAPENELDEEILGLQLNLVGQAQGNRHQCEQLVLKIIPNLSKELRTSWKKSKDLALVSYYLSLLREAKKQGRKERRSKEAQAVLAAATAVAAASSRLGALRKDGLGSHTIDEKPYLGATDYFGVATTATSESHGVNATRPSLLRHTSYGWTTSQTSSCGKASSLDQDIKTFDCRNQGIESNSGESREELILCDVCKDSSTSSLATICHRCKVAVHQHCYGINSTLTSDWLCQPCMEITQQCQGLESSDVIDRATPGHNVFCLLCSGRSGAFRRSADGKWVHVFCAQWFPEFSDKDDAGLHESLKLATVEKVVHECSICHMKQGARLRCSFGHCHGSFHPLCARDSGLFMSVKRGAGGRIQQRAYCEKHSAQQRQKAASRRCGSSDEFNVLLQMRAELERVRILCERVCKRERLKRDRLLCTLDIYTAHLSSLSSSAMASNDLSSTSNTFDTTVAFQKMSSLHSQLNDSFTARPHHGLESESLSWNSVAGEGSKYQDSLSGDSVYQTQVSCSEPSRETPAKSQLSDATALQIQGRLNMLVEKNGEQKRLGKHQKAETLHTEVVMTPTEASVQNQRLPKGYAYVPVGTLPKAKLNLTEASALKDV